MREVILTFALLVLMCFLIPIIFTNKFEVKQTNSEEIIENNEVKEDYNYKNYNNIKLLHSKTGEVEEINIDEYLYGVVASEMPASFEQEALKAQAIVARTYTIYKIENATKHENAHICDDSTCCQAWISKQERLEKWKEEERENNWNRIVEAVKGTSGKVVTYEGKPINAFFHSNSGGKTEIVSNVWGGRDYPYLQVVETSGENAYSQYSSEVEMSKLQVLEKIKEYHSNIRINFEENDSIQITEYTESNRVKMIKFGNINLSGVEARNIFGLKSTNFTVNIENDTVKFKVIGYGHGVGLSQTGADSMAKQGKSCEDIIKHYYTNVEITYI